MAVAESGLSWVTLTSLDVQKAKEIIKDLGADSTVDSIGLGLPFEAISEILFPATSTLHTRVRYSLFVSGIMYKMLLDARDNSKKIKNPEANLKKYEKELQDILIQNDPEGGVIGKKSKEKLKYWPSLTYWGAINSLGVFGHRISRDALFEEIRGTNEAVIITDDGSREGEFSSSFEFDNEFAQIAFDMFQNDKFKESHSFSLTKKEAIYLIRKLGQVEVGKDTLLYEWIRSDLERLEKVKNFPQIKSTGNAKVDALVKQAKNYSRVSMGITHAYRWALCRAVSRRFSEQSKAEEWQEYAENNKEFFGGWLRKNADLKDWSLGELKLAMAPYAVADKIDDHLKKMFQEFSNLWNTDDSIESFLEKFDSVVREQECHRRKNRSQFIESTMRISDRTKGAKGDYLFNFRFGQGHRNAMDILKAMEGGNAK